MSKSSLLITMKLWQMPWSNRYLVKIRLLVILTQKKSPCPGRTSLQLLSLRWSRSKNPLRILQFNLRPSRTKLMLRSKCSCQECSSSRWWTPTRWWLKCNKWWCSLCKWCSNLRTQKAVKQAPTRQWLLSSNYRWCACNWWCNSKCSLITPWWRNSTSNHNRPKEQAQTLKWQLPCLEWCKCPVWWTLSKWMECSRWWCQDSTQINKLPTVRVTSSQILEETSPSIERKSWMNNCILMRAERVGSTRQCCEHPDQEHFLLRLESSKQSNSSLPALLAKP